MSGDVNTALGNTIIQLFVLSYITRSESVDLVVEGDDAVVIGDVEAIDRLAKVVAEDGLEVGFQLKNSVATCLEEVEYCSSRPLETKPGVWVSVRDFPKPLLTDLLTAKAVHSSVALNQKARTMAVCFAMQYTGLPVYAEWAMYLLSHAAPGRRGLDEWYDRNFWVKTVMDAKEQLSSNFGSIRVEEPSVTARASFYVSFGIEPSEQRHIEALLRLKRGPHPVEILTEESATLRRAAARF